MTKNDMSSLLDRIGQLKAENQKLREEVAFLRTHPTISQGIRGETLVANVVDGRLTAYRSGHDVETENGAKIEVKFSKLNEPVKGRPTRRWNWSKPIGHMDKGKEYDYLLLLGEADERFPEQYEEGVPYVCFLLPYGDVRSVMTRGAAIGSMIQLTSNLDWHKRKEPPTRLLRYLVGYEVLAGLLDA